MPDSRPSHVSTIIDDTAAAEVPVLSCTMGLLLLVYAVVDALTHPASQAVWRTLTSVTPGVMLLLLFAASVRRWIGPAQSVWATAGGILTVGAAILVTLWYSRSTTDLCLLLILVVMSGSASLRIAPFAGVLLVLSAGVVVGAQWLGPPAATVQTSEWYAVLLVALTASVAVHHERTRVLVRLAQAHDDLEQQATVDPLAGVHTRYGMTCAFPLVRAQAARAAVPVFALFVDVDGLKGVNDTLGHDAGDLLIRHAAEALRHTARASDVVARWGGDEFVVLGAGTPPPLARLEETVEALLRARWHRPDVAPATVSLGLAVTNPADADLETLIVRADADMYERRRVRRGEREHAGTAGAAV